MTYIFLFDLGFLEVTIFSIVWRIVFVLIYVPYLKIITVNHDTTLGRLKTREYKY